MFALGEQGAQLLPGNINAVVAAEDADQVDVKIQITAGRLNPIHDRLHHPCGIKLKGLRHEPGAEAQLAVVDAFITEVLHILVSDAPAGIVIHQHASHPLELLEESHQTRLRLGHLDVRAQALHIPGWQRQVMLLRPRSRIVSRRRLPSRWRCRSIKGSVGSIIDV